jgi:hypothetical protein
MPSREEEALESAAATFPSPPPTVPALRAAPPDPARSVRESLLDPPPPPPRAGGGAPYTGREAALALAQGKAGGSDGAVPLSAAEAFLTSAQASPLQLLLDYTPPSYKPTRGDPLHDFLRTSMVGVVPLAVARTVRKGLENLTLQGATLTVAIPGTAAPGRSLSLSMLVAELAAAARAQVPEQVTGILASTAGAGRRLTALQAQAKGTAEAAARGDALGAVGGAAKTAANAVGGVLETGTGAVASAIGAGAMLFSKGQEALAWGSSKKDAAGKMGAHDVTASAGGQGGLEGAGTSVLTGVTQVGKGFYKGLKGVFVDPIRGAQREGVGGFFKGVGTGVAGIVVRPMAGILGGAQTVLSGVHNTVDDFFDTIGLDVAAEDAAPDRVRPPRALYSPATAAAIAARGAGGGGGGGPPSRSPTARVVKKYDDIHAKVLFALVRLAQQDNDKALAAALLEPLVAVAGGAGGRSAAPFRDGSTALLTGGHLIHFSGGESEELRLRCLVRLPDITGVDVVGGGPGGAPLALVVSRASGAPSVELLFAEGAGGAGVGAARKLEAAIKLRQQL